jgi:hypothetical protein
VCYKPKTNAILKAYFLNSGAKIPLPSAFEAQHQQFERAFAVLSQAIEQHAFPGAAVMSE